ncbi:general secretion pathway protein GspB [Aliamphritea ceti]|uniref:general secretion pathway protein GspB n=1 Tax=Aliamphritea ceti TaxID=1524258 RepID=UPI0021C26BC6|nr:general secretion pathway protein GspB [Aliamphritea ceti]
MSYILDSLKRSDEERTRGSVPDLQSLPLISSGPAKKKPSRLYWALLLTMLAITIYVTNQLLFTASLQPQTASPETSFSDNAILTTETAQPLQKNSFTEPTDKKQSNTDIPQNATENQQLASDSNDSVKGINTLDSLGISSDTQSRLKGIKVKLEATKFQLADEIKPQQILSETNRKKPSEKQEAHVTGIQTIASNKAINAIQPVTKAEKVQKIITAKSQPVKNPYQGVMHVKQLPTVIKRELPELNFSVHIYSENTASRMVKINGRSYREGQTVSQYLTLNEITRDGVIMTFKDERFWQLSR